ncbi:MAG: TlyA family RNA methyltransferase [Alphaproteobacteria bacterium]|nr:TlyA family RNA methyltransferase [Alphaproteobacteria bacterium]
MKKQRADLLLVEQGLAENAAKAQALIMSGVVLCGTKRIDKAGEVLKSDSVLTVKSKAFPWVSRGGLKLVKGLDDSGIDPTGLVCLDVGCSTGGFTDVLLTQGAKRVYAVDVGYGQLAQKLRTDDRVVVLERMNARYLTPEHIPEEIDLIVCDASFIRLENVLPKPMSFAKKTGAFLIALIKPQFEVERHQVGENGVVRDPELHASVCAHVREWIDGLPGWTVKSLTPSPIKGPEGNIEFLISAAFFDG